MVEQWNSDGGTVWRNSETVMVEQWWNSKTVVVEQWNSDSGTVWWNSDGGIVLVERFGGTVWWNSATVL